MAAPALCKAGKKAVDKAKEAFVKTLESTVVKPVADATADFTRSTLKETLTWWLYTKSLQMKGSGFTDLQSPCGKPDTGSGADGKDGKVKEKDKKDDEVDPRCKDSAGKNFSSVSLQAILFGLGVMIATLLTMVQAIRTAIRRKGTPLMEALQGLMVAVLTCAVGITVIDSLLVASDKLTESILNVSFNGKDNMPDVVVKVLLPAMSNPMAVILMATVVLLVGLCQVVLLFLRQAAIPIQGLILPIAAAGQVGGSSTRQWLPRLATAIMTVIAYKPLAAVIISVGFLEMEYSTTMIDWIRGVVTLVLSVFALKALMGVFAPLGVAVTGGGGGAALGSLLNTAGSFLGARSGRGGGSAAPTSATDHADYMKRSTGNSGGPGPSAGGTAIQHSQNPPPGGPASGAGGAAGQAGAPGAAGTAGAGGAAGTAGTAAGAAGSAGSAAGGAGAAGGGAAAAGPVGIAIVAAEAVNQGIQSAGNSMSEGSKK
ncbi:hypothetical protein [Streptomyces sp. NPDC000405]|uniref:hypothetical protein n=1 Tax=Streptomyces sp. NPDC000405 TaxID=3161033 RepID=UPI00398CA2DA